MINSAPRAPLTYGQMGVVGVVVVVVVVVTTLHISASANIDPIREFLFAKDAALVEDHL